MDLQQLKKETVAVLGYGMEGKATLAYLQKHGISPIIFDMKSLDQLEVTDQEFLKNSGLRLVLGPNCLQELAGVTVAFRSPGIWRLHPDLIAAEEKGLSVTSQTDWFFKHSQASIVGITGTKGKGTTSTLIYEIIKNALTEKEFDQGRLYDDSRVFLTGNIGKIAPFEIVDSLTSHDVVVFELSSFQLQDITKSPHVGVCVMVTQEHLDVHQNLEEYIAAKSAITKFQLPGDVSISNIDYPASRQIGLMGQGEKLVISRSPLEVSGVFIQGDTLTLYDNGRPSRVFDFSARQLRGSHNMENIAAAVLAALSMGVSVGVIEKVARDFMGLEHRLEYVDTRDGVVFYNDSFSTTPETSIAAIRSFSEPMVLILGGSEKNSDFTELGRVVAKSSNIRAIVLVGVTASRIEKEITRNGYTGKLYRGASSMAEIFQQISEIVEPGTVVLLSPGCASFGMFKNYIERGIQFKEYAHTWRKHA